MDETMRIIIAYALLVLGLPLLIAKILWFLPGIIFTKIFTKIAERMDRVIDASIEGFIAMLSACLVFNRLDVHIALAVPVILITVNSLWDWSKEEALRAWSSTAGIVGGFFLYPGVFNYLGDRIIYLNYMAGLPVFWLFG